MRSLISIFTILLTVLITVGQTRFVRNFSVADGLSQSEVSDIIEDAEGRMLLNTAARGVDIFDGFEFTTLLESDGLCSPFVQKLVKDDNGRIFALSLRGLSRYHSGSFEPLPFSSRLENVSSFFAAISAIDDGIFIGTDNGLLWANGIEHEQYFFEERTKIFSLLTDSDGTLLCGTDHGLYRFNSGKFTLLNDLRAEQEATVYSMQRMPNNELLLGLKSGYAIIQENEYEFHSLPSIEDNSIISAKTISSGEVLLGTNGHGIIILRESGELTFLNESNGLHDNYIWSIEEDEQGNLWLGTSGGGVDILGKSRFLFYSQKDGISGDIIYDIHQAPDGSMWFGAVEGGVSVLRDGTISTYGTKDGLSHRSVRSTFQDNDTLWIGTENGVTIFVNGRFKDVSDLLGLRNYAIFDIHRAQDGKLWFACKGERYYGANGGVVIWDGEKSLNLTTEDGLVDNNVYCIHEDKQELWLGTAAGISIWNGSEFRTLTRVADTPCESAAICMRKDAKGTTWIGTLGGLAYYQDGRYQCLEIDSKLKADFIFLLELQGDSLLWVGSSNGLERFDLNEFYSTGQIKAELFNSKNGFKGTECNQNAVCIDRDGQYWFGTIEGAIRMNPSVEKSKGGKLKTFVRSIKPNGKFLSDSLQLQVRQGKRVELEHDENNLIIEFSSNQLLDPSSVHYSFRMVSTDQGWSEPSRERSVFYSNLEPGDHRFEMKAKNINTGEETSTRTLEFKIIPYFTQTTWFRVLYWSLASFLILGAIFWRITSIRNEERKASEYQHSLHELEMKALRAQINPHFVFNTLNSLNNFIVQKKPEEASDYLTKFAKLIRLVLQNSEEKLVSLEEELNALDLYMKLEQLRFSGSFEYSIHVSSEVNQIKERIPPLLLQPYIENSIWHGIQHLKGEHGKIAVAIKREGEGLIIEITDNGIGREKAIKLKSKSALKKKSMGMQLNEDRIRLAKELYKGESTVDIIDLKDSQGKASGTMVKLVLNYV